jgi:hypothetical protein
VPRMIRPRREASIGFLAPDMCFDREQSGNASQCL